jgi:hypothetical protein
MQWNWREITGKIRWNPVLNTVAVFRWFPVIFCRDTVSSGLDTLNFLLNSGPEYDLFPQLFPGNGFERIPFWVFRRHTASTFRIFPGVSCGKYAGTCRNWPENARIPAGSRRIRRAESSSWGAKT